MKAPLNQKGFSAVEGVIVLAVVMLLGVGGYLVFNRQNDSSKNQATSEQASEAKDVPAAPAISSKDDLDEAEATLDQTDLEANNTDASQLDSELSNF